MLLREYQLQARLTDQTPGDDLRGRVIPLLGLAGEVGSLLTEFKKQFRDGDAHRLFREQVKDDLGDLLWYVANVATKHGLDLGEIAAANLAKTRDRWPPGGGGTRRLFDESFPPDEQLPRTFEVAITEEEVGGTVCVRCHMGGRPLGDALTDNSHTDDGYRFHDVFHLAFAAVLGWSPIARSLMGRKRRSVREFDDVEDGGRAKVIEEAVSVLVYDYARGHNFLEGVTSLDYPLLKTIRGLVADREVGARSLREWEQAIIEGYRVWRLVRRHGGGLVVGDLRAGTIEWRLLQ